jgi:hypothetical protein
VELLQSPANPPPIEEEPAILEINQESSNLDKILDKVEHKEEFDKMTVKKKLEKLKAKDISKIIEKKEESQK